ncbi:MAG TPA: cyclic nucleotide-binding domain-containing protein [Actinomycetes bacterium]|nr:cyclic nucleotide-binding domain-containing protein [Actinomycetes bacterium]
MSQPTADDLSRVPLLASLDTHAQERLAPRFDVAEFDAGERIVAEGTPGLDLYVIDSGRATATQRGRGLIRLLGPGDFFGEIALLGKGMRTATITAASPMVLWVLHGDAIRLLQGEHPEVTEALSTAMQDRLSAEWI